VHLTLEANIPMSGSIVFCSTLQQNTLMTLMWGTNEIHSTLLLSQTLPNFFPKLADLYRFFDCSLGLLCSINKSSLKQMKKHYRYDNTTKSTYYWFFKQTISSCFSCRGDLPITELKIYTICCPIGWCYEHVMAKAIYIGKHIID
jgi:hypothetical protein